MRRAHLGRIFEVKRIRAPVVAPRSRAFGFCTSTGPIPVWIARTGSCPWRTTRRRKEPARHSRPGMSRTPPRPPGQSAVARRLAEFRSEDHRSPLFVEEKRLYSRSWRNAPAWRSGWFDHQPRYAAFLIPSPSFPRSSVFRRQSLIDVAIQRAALCLDSSGKRHPHQRRIPEDVLRAANSKLQDAKKAIGAAADFTARKSG